ncbi:AI-2E family transporter [Labrys monachus]|uniref:PurR-regulated permease PerM n=1 Tax=Labrys monachus TaxID=217067 RepID=A0ABU0FA18_9HYPH|nr:AI-2E family transporter [Labrys monachus]MDQ0391459.1 putative PurR-regulated permease PerM [Labrys monachus]
MAGSRFSDERRRASPEPPADVEGGPSGDPPADLLRPPPDLVLRYAAVGILLILLVGALKASQLFSMPITAGVVLGLIFGPVTDWIADRGVPRALAAALVVVSFLAILLVAAGMLAVPLALWADQIPAMIAVLRAKVALLFDLGRLLGDATVGPAEAPVQALIAAGTGGGSWLEVALASGAFAGGFLLCIFTMYFYLSTRRQMEAHVLRLWLKREARKSAGDFFDRVERRVALYLGIITVINCVMGLIAGLLAWGGGFIYPPAWAAFAAMMNYIPLIGPLIVTAALLAAGFLVAPTAVAALWPAGLYFLCHLVEGELATPALVGHRLTTSPLLVFLSFAFWLWLWGPVGAVLATPILLIIVVAFRVFAEYRHSVDPASDDERA